MAFPRLAPARARRRAADDDDFACALGQALRACGVDVTIVATADRVFANQLDGSQAGAVVGSCCCLREPGLPPGAPCGVSGRRSTDGLRGFAEEHRFSPQESAVLAGLVDELTTNDLAERLRCKPSTIKTYLQRIYNKTGRSSQTELLAYLVNWLMEPSQEPCGEADPEGSPAAQRADQFKQ
jgi:DNA-binding CsgD family transcriptional regulator